MWDLKPSAPAEIRGEFRPISTNVPGIQICELFPRIAKMMDKFVIIRSLADSDGAHDGYQCMTGHKRSERAPRGGHPAAGSWVSRLAGPVNPAVPANLALMYATGNRTWGEPETAGFLGTSHNPFNLVGKKAREKSDNMVLKGITLERLRDRSQLRSSLDRFRREADADGQDGRRRYVHVAGPGHSHRLEARRRPRPVEGRPQDRRALRQERRRTSSATARRGWSRTSASPGGWSRPAPATWRSTTAAGTGTAATA